MTTAWQRHGWLKQLSENSLQWIAATTHNSQYETISKMKWNWHNLEYVMFTVLNHIFAHLWGVGGFSLPSSPIRPARPWALRFCLIMFEKNLTRGFHIGIQSASEAPIRRIPRNSWTAGDADTFFSQKKRCTELIERIWLITVTVIMVNNG